MSNGQLYPLGPHTNRIGKEESHHVKEPTQHATQTDYQVRSPPEEAAETENPGAKTDRQEEVMQHPGWLLIIVGLFIAGIGFIWLIAPSIPWLGKLPGDIAVEGKSFRFYFPVMTCIVLSLLLTGILWLVRFFSR